MVAAGEKYMGKWQDNCRHGNGVIVTVDGIYFEGIFVQDSISVRHAATPVQT